MSYLIIGDSCTDLTPELKKDARFVTVPLTLQIGEETFTDDDSFNQKEFLEKMAASSECSKSACPAPESYMALFERADEIFIVTLSSHLSGSHNCAMLAKSLYEEQNENKKIAVIDSLSASCGQTLIAMKIAELKEKGLSFEEVVKEAETFRSDMTTYFVLESLENLRKNGRLSNMKAFIANALNIKPVMAGNEGTIEKVDQARGTKKALGRMAALIEGKVKHPETRTLAIAHCNNLERAEYVKSLVTEKVTFKDVMIVDTAGVSTLYANDGGIIVCF